MSALALNRGDTISLHGPVSNLLKVIRRIRGGYAVLPNGAEVEVPVMDSELLDAYIEKRLHRWPCNLENLDDRRAKMLQKSLDGLAPGTRRETLRRLAYVSKVDEQRARYSNVLKTCDAVIPIVFGEHGADWQAQERDAAVEAAALIRKREGEEVGGGDPLFRLIEAPKSTTVRTWYSEWLKCGKDPMSLAPMWEARGYRQPRFDVAKSEDEQDTYKLADQAAREMWLTLLQKTKQIAYEYYKRLCLKHGVSQIMSGRTFRRFLDKRFDEIETHTARYGKKSAHLKYGTFSLRELPDRALEEVEVDHCLVDLLVVDENGKLLGRPWITVLLDRATKCIVGIHVSFMPPSYASVQRALAHALYPKDLSRFSGLKNSWKAFGLVEWLISDRGKDFLSRNFREACLLLSIYPLALPGRKPWLKGAVERLFGTMNVRVFNTKEGSTKAWNPDTYNAVKRASVTRAEFDQTLVEWIVDDYHQTPHPALERKYGREMSPDQAWDMLAKYVRFAPDPHVAFRLTGEIFERQIGSTGISIKGLLYSNPTLFDKILKRPGSRERNWKFRRDRFDLGRIWFLDEEAEDGITWHVIPCVDPDLSNGVTEQQFALWGEKANEIAPDADFHTVATLRRAKQLVEQNREKALSGTTKVRKALQWAKYGEIGLPFTDIPGFGEYYYWGQEPARPPSAANDHQDPVAALIPNDPVEPPETSDDCLPDVDEHLVEKRASFGAGIDEEALQMLREMAA